MKNDFELSINWLKVKQFNLLLIILATLLASAPSCFAQSQATSSGRSPTSPILTPTNTVGSTASSVRGGNRSSSGYSAGGNTANTNINNTQTRQGSNGQPIGAGSQTSNPSGNK